MGKEGETVKSVPRPFATIEWTHHEQPDRTASPTGVLFKGAQRPKWRPPAAEGAASPADSKEGQKQKLKLLQESLFATGQKTKSTEKTVPLAIHDALKREKDQLAMQLKALAEKHEGSKKRIAALEQDLFTAQELTTKYEGMYVVPLNDDLHALSESIAEIDREIKKYGTAIVEKDENLPAKKIPLPDSEAGKAQVLLETKVQRMEQLVYTLKKRVNKYENCVDDRSDTAKFDSKEYLRKENLRLSQEVKRLMTAEKRFDTESLLDNRMLSTYDPMLFDVLITALQDDLRTHKKLLDKYSFEKNPELQYIVASPAPLEEIQGLPHLLEEWGCDDELMASEPGPAEDVDTLKHQNQIMKEQMDKIMGDYDQLAQQLEMERESSGVEGRRLTGKARKIELLMESNKENLKRISEANMQVRKKEEIIAMQEELTKKYIRDKEALLDDTMALNREVGKQRARNKELRSAVEALHSHLRIEERKYTGVHTLCMSMIHAFCLRSGVKTKLPVNDSCTLRSTVPANFMELWSTMSQAIIVIQAASRGTLGRIKLVERFGRDKVRSWAERQDLDNKTLTPSHSRTVEMYEQMGLTQVQAKKAVATNEREGPARTAFQMPPLLERFPATLALAELIKFSPKDQYNWVELPEVFKIVKAEICSVLRRETEAEMATMKEEIVRLGCNMLRQVTVKTMEKRPQAVQVGAPLSNLAEFEMQTDEEPPVPEADGKKKK